MEKLFAMSIAAQLTQASSSGATGLPLSPDLSDNQVRARNLQVWETFRVFYRGVIAALEDTKSWPAPAIDAGHLVPSFLQNLVQSLSPLLSPLLASGPLADIVKRLLAALPAPSAALAGPIPDPGVK